jgi:hypothetical protein
MESILVHPQDPRQLEQIIAYLVSLKVPFDVQDPSPADDAAGGIEDDIDAGDEGKVISFDDFRRKQIDIKPEMLKEIAEQLDTGMVCFYHKISGEMECYPDELRNPGYDEEMWEDIINKVEQNEDDYLRFEGMSSFESFGVMESFVSNIEHIPTHNKFIDALSRKKPFRNFSDLLFYYPELREEWFVYKLDRYIDFVKGQIEFE